MQFCMSGKKQVTDMNSSGKDHAPGGRAHTAKHTEEPSVQSLASLVKGSLVDGGLVSVSENC